MAWQPREEKDAERQLITTFANKINAKVIKLQGDSDDGGTDGVIDYGGKQINVEARRKGFPNHSGKASYLFREGWASKCLAEGIFLNEMTIEHYKDKGFIFIVEIKGYKLRGCVVTASKVDELLNQPHREMKSTNSGVMQSVKTVPLHWFKEV